MFIHLNITLNNSFVCRRLCSSVGRDRSLKYQRVEISSNSYASFIHLVHNIFHVLGMYHKYESKYNV